jgi:hypothetical protein
MEQIKYEFQFFAVLSKTKQRKARGEAVSSESENALCKNLTCLDMITNGIVGWDLEKFFIEEKIKAVENSGYKPYSGQEM